MAAAAPGARTLHLALSATNFAQGLGAFSMIGILALVARDFALQPSQAGLLLSLYAAVYAIASPLLVAASGVLERRSVLAGGLLFVGGGAAAAALAPNFAVLLLARCVMALGGAVTTPVAASIGVATSHPDARGRVLATVFAGLVLAQSAGVPFSAWLGGLWSWRAPLLLVFGVSALALAAVAWKVPRRLPVQVSSLAALGAVLRMPHALAAVSFIVFYVGCNLTLLTYLAPYLGTRFDLSQTQVAAALLAYGGFAFAGNAVGGRLTDRFGSGRTLVLLAAIMLVVLPAITLGDWPLAPTLLLVGLWGLFGWAVHVPQQARLAQTDPARAPLLLALHSAGIYLGVSLGATLAGLVLQWGDARWLGPAGASLAVCALASLGVTRVFAARAARRTPRRASGSPIGRA
ncbi:MAG TPA: MFS transporter [Ramlibacter sp.]|nr:MFS transporter [Ramlibacter sp.]